MSIIFLTQIRKNILYKKTFKVYCVLSKVGVFKDYL